MGDEQERLFPEVTYTNKRQIISPPPGLVAWAVIRDEPKKWRVRGPWPVIAIQFEWEEFTGAAIETTESKIMAPDWYEDVSYGDGTDTAVEFLLAIPDLANMCNPWIEKAYIFFEQADANKAAAELNLL